MGKAAKAAVTKVAKNKIVRELGEELAEKLLKDAENPADIAKSIKKLTKNGVAKETIEEIAEKYGEKGLKAARHGDDAVKAVLKHGDKATDLINTYGKKAAKTIADYGDNAVKAIAEHGDDAVKLITKHGDDAAKAIAEHGDKAVKIITDHGSDAAELIAKHGNIAIDCIYESNEKAFRNAAKQIDKYPVFNDISLAIGRQTDLSNADRVKKLQDLLEYGGYKADVNVPADTKYLKTNGFDGKGAPDYDWPKRLGFKESSIEGITREAPLPDQWDRYGYLGGTNFADIPANGKAYTYSERAIPYVENPNAYHHGTFDSKNYFDIIDCIRNGDLTGLNDISPTEVSKADFKKLVEAYENYSESAAKAVKGLGEDIDYTYGLQGFAESWLDMEGGATQYVTPISGSWLETFGILKEIK